MRIGIIGTGRMGTGLGRLWAQGGHRVMMGSRDPQKAKSVAASIGNGAGGGSIAEAAAFGEVVVVATPWDATAAVLQEAGPLQGKIVIDVTNPLKADASGLAVGQTTSGAELIAKAAVGAKVVKAFNSVYWENLDARKFGAPKPSLFFCGDDRGAKIIVAKLGEELGFEPVDSGPLAIARYLEPLACLWMQLANTPGFGPTIAFSLTRRG